MKLNVLHMMGPVSFNAALPAMGLVLKISKTGALPIAFQCCFARNGFSIQQMEPQYLSAQQFQCCFACNGFSIILMSLKSVSLKSFNAALPAMGLVFRRLDEKYNQNSFQCCFACKGFSILRRMPILKRLAVSMLLRLQWV